jgi:predicted 3-demethylubiquinone-9 3-methyltransferase (glyoxalase superfamily)
MQKIIPHLWFNNRAEEAVNLYISVFRNSGIQQVNRYEEEGTNISGMAKDTVMTVDFKLEGQEFIALNGGPAFTFTPAISFFVNCDTDEELNRIWYKLSEGGAVLMELDKYPFSEKFGWIQDKFGVNWQLNLAHRKQKITPFLMFVGEQHGKAEEAMDFYISLFENSRITDIKHYLEGEGNPEGTVKHSTFLLQGQEFMAIDSNYEHSFTFNEAISFFVNCDTQEEVDELWEKFTKEGEESHCGWLKDKYGVSWQIIPTALGKMLNDPDSEKAQRVMKEMLQMKKIDTIKLQEAYEGR